FWKSRWLGNFSLKDTFPGLFSIAENKNALVQEMVRPFEKNSVWDWKWRRRLFEWEQQQVQGLES
ncbi:hypothetical protein glysoja_046887, partial [Glycine soja]